MQPRHLVTVNGTVLNLRHVEIPPREATDTAKAYDGGTYEEVTLATPLCELDGEALEGIQAYVTVRFSSDDDTLQHLIPGSEVALLCSTFVEVYKIRGRWANSVGYRFARLAVPLRQRSAA